ncbi:MAG: cyclase family protein [Hyphomicrobiaceae bacterium]
MTARWMRRPDGSNWGEFGPDDEVGRLNLITPEKVRQGIAEVREGRTFCLSLPLDYPGGNVLHPARHPPQRFATATPDGKVRSLLPTSQATGNPDLTDVVNDDRVILHTQYSTQWDALSHVGAMFDADGDGRDEVVFYNGWRGGSDITLATSCDDDCGGHPGATASRLGIENMARRCVQGRAVMIDLRAAFGDAKKDVTFAELRRVMDDQHVVVEPGDMVCLHTGFADRVLGMGRAPEADTIHNMCSALEGRDPDLQDWVRESGLAVLIADNYAVERAPSETGTGPRAMLPLHELCLFKLGIHLGEIWYLTELAVYLAANRRNRFLLTAPPLFLPGAVGSPTTPIATV